MAHKYSHISTGGGFAVKNGAVTTEVISQAGVVSSAATADASIESAKLAANTIQYKEVSLTAAQIIALYTTSVEVIPAVSGKIIVLDSFVFDLTGTATQFTGGGVVNLQYDSTANGAGTTLHADIAATVVTGATGRVITHRIPKDLSAVATASITGKGVYIGAKTANFAAGTGTCVLKVSFHLV
jgi:ABC-type Co2+ transport system permease subunit